MTALAKDKNVGRRRTEEIIVLKVKAATKIYQGAMVAVEGASGWAVPAGDTAAHQVMGFALDSADNSTGANGDKTLRVQKGTFKVNNGTTAVVQATIGDNVFVEDDQTVRSAGATNSIVAGVAVEIDPDDAGIWINIE